MRRSRMMLRTLSDRTTAYGVSPAHLSIIDASSGAHAFIFTNVFEGKSQACIFSLDDPNLAKGPLPYHAQQAEVIEIDCNVHRASANVSLGRGPGRDQGGRAVSRKLTFSRGRELMQVELIRRSSEYWAREQGGKKGRA